jgi:hypothetical protein
MAGTTVFNIAKKSKGSEPRGVFNWRLWFAVVSFALMGTARGVFDDQNRGVCSDPLLSLPIQ